MKVYSEFPLPFENAIVVGAAGEMGSMLMEELRLHGHGVTGIDLAGGTQILELDIQVLSGKLASLLAAADLVVLAVSDTLAAEVGPRLAQFLAADAVLVDCTSVKHEYIARVLNHGKCEKLSINPLFGANLKPEGRTIAVTPISVGPAVDRFLAFLRATGALVAEMSSDEHDRAMAVYQSGVHAVLLSFLTVPQAAEALAPPPADIMRRLGARVITGTPSVYWAIQARNPYARAIRRQIIDALESIDTAANTGNEDRFFAIFGQARSNLRAEAEKLSLSCAALFQSATGTAALKDDRNE
jgi:prephenate dehydrogenase